MACTACACSAGLLNTGTACSPIMKGARSIILVPYYTSLGVQNSINLSTATLDSTYFTALINNTDVSLRWFPLPTLKNVEQKRQDPVYETFNDDSKQYIRQGIKSFEGLIAGRYASPLLAGNINGARCVEVGMYIIDADGNLIGSIDSTGVLLYPIRLDADSIDAVYNMGTDKTQANIHLMFNVNVAEKDENLRMIACSEMSIDALISLIGTGLVDVTPVVSSITKTTFVVTMNTGYGTPLNPVRVTGLVVTDFVSSVTATTSKLRDLTTSADLTISGIVESTTTKGQYTVTYAGGVQNHYMAVTAKKNGYVFAVTNFQDTLT